MHWSQTKRRRWKMVDYHYFVYTLFFVYLNSRTSNQAVMRDSISFQILFCLQYFSFKLNQQTQTPLISCCQPQPALARSHIFSAGQTETTSGEERVQQTPVRSQTAEKSQQNQRCQVQPQPGGGRAGQSQQDGVRACRAGGVPGARTPRLPQ